MLYEATQLRLALPIQKIYTIHYYEYDSHFQFEGEAHDFWEFVYADRGEAAITRDGEQITLSQGNAILHAPGVFHTLRTLGEEGLNLMVLSFSSNAKALNRLTRSPFPIFQPDKQLLSSILTEARQCFSSPLDSNYFKLRRRADAPLGGEQLIGIWLQGLLISLLRRLDLPVRQKEGGNFIGDKVQEEQLSLVIAHMQNNLLEPLSIEELCQKCHISRSKLQRLFRQHMGQSALHYFINLRIEEAKNMIRNRLHSFGEIADLLGFPSIHYFSRQFKQVTGMSPSEYNASLRSLSDKQSC